jgi:hypothetical protein
VLILSDGCARRRKLIQGGADLCSARAIPIVMVTTGDPVAGGLVARALRALGLLKRNTRINLRDVTPSNIEPADNYWGGIDEYLGVEE